MPMLLIHALKDVQKGVPYIIAQAWQLETDGLEGDDLIPTLAKAMTRGTNAEAVFSGLGDRERGALKMLLSERGRGGNDASAKIAEAKFRLIYGEIRPLGEDALKRESPLARPRSAAEALFYRGLVFVGRESTDTGPRTVIYIPDDMADVIEPMTHYETVYSDTPDEFDSDDDGGFDDDDGAPQAAKAAPAKAGAPAKASAPVKAGAPAPVKAAAPAPAPAKAVAPAPIKAAAPAPARPALPLPALRDIETRHAADTSIVDDLATLLAYFVVHRPIMFQEGEIVAEHLHALTPVLLSTDTARLRFILELAYSLDLITIEDGRLHTRTDRARVWLNDPRWKQMYTLADGWRRSSACVELQHVPGIAPEMNTAPLDQYNAAAVRGIVLDWLRRAVPLSEWWSIEAFVAHLREAQPDFQRPNGDFNTWYIRDAHGQYIDGIAGWDAVEGGLLRHIVSRPMHWLALVDLAQPAARLTAYGRAFMTGAAYPQPPEPHEKIDVALDGTITVSRRVSRYDRFQTARFTTWGPMTTGASAAYRYRLDSTAIANAAEAGITTVHIATFLNSALGDTPLPRPVAALLEKWKSGAAATATFERVLVLRTPSPEMMKLIYDTPALRRFMGAQLGESAGIVLTQYADALRDALGEQGVKVEWLGE
jgi:hypothetical protein